jgi:hypothetical protein
MIAGTVYTFWGVGVDIRPSVALMALPFGRGCLGLRLIACHSMQDDRDPGRAGKERR